MSSLGMSPLAAILLVRLLVKCRALPRDVHIQLLIRGSLTYARQSRAKDFRAPFLPPLYQSNSASFTLQLVPRTSLWKPPKC